MEPESIISTILKHDKKVNTYKFALLRAINDVALSFPDLRSFDRDVAVPLKLLAQFWVAYYWPFVKPNQPILQGQRAILGDELRNDMAFRPQTNGIAAGLGRNYWWMFPIRATGFSSLMNSEFCAVIKLTQRNCIELLVSL